jgi:hypothetical protein
MGVNVAFDISDNTDDIEPPMVMPTAKLGADVDLSPSKARLLSGNLSGSVANYRYSQADLNSGGASPLQSPGDPGPPAFNNGQPLGLAQGTSLADQNRQLKPSVARKNLNIILPDSKEADRTLEK